MKAIQHLTPLRIDGKDRLHGRRMASTRAVSFQLALSAGVIWSSRTNSRAPRGPTLSQLLVRCLLTRLSATFPACSWATTRSGPLKKALHKQARSRKCNIPIMAYPLPHFRETANCNSSSVRRCEFSHSEGGHGRRKCAGLKNSFSTRHCAIA
jgi:hypothetical protein